MSETVNVPINAERRPELGTAEAALRSCVNLIARATGQPEELLAYWLDLYYQVRRMQEPTLEDLVVPPALSRARPQQAAPAPVAPEPVGISEQFQPVAPKKSPRAESAEFKRATYARLLDARNSGVPVPRIVKLAEPLITEDQVRAILAAQPTPIAVYRVLAAALDRLQAEEGKA